MSTFYSIAEIAQKLGITAHTLRYYERIGLIDHVNRAGNSHRRYTQDDVRWLVFLQRLRSTKMSIKQMQRYATLRRAGNHVESLMERRAMLTEHARYLHAELVLLQETLVVLDDKVNLYTELERDAINKG